MEYSGLSPRERLQIAIRFAKHDAKKYFLTAKQKVSPSTSISIQKTSHPLTDELENEIIDDSIVVQNKPFSADHKLTAVQLRRDTKPASKRPLRPTGTTIEKVNVKTYTAMPPEDCLRDISNLQMGIENVVKSIVDSVLNKSAFNESSLSEEALNKLVDSLSRVNNLYSLRRQIKDIFSDTELVLLHPHLLTTTKRVKILQRLSASHRATLRALKKYAVNATHLIPKAPNTALEISSILRSLSDCCLLLNIENPLSLSADELCNAVDFCSSPLPEHDTIEESMIEIDRPSFRHPGKKSRVVETRTKRGNASKKIPSHLSISRKNTTSFSKTETPLQEEHFQQDINLDINHVTRFSSSSPPPSSNHRFDSIRPVSERPLNASLYSPDNLGGSDQSLSDSHISPIQTSRKVSSSGDVLSANYVSSLASFRETVRNNIDLLTSLIFNSLMHQEAVTIRRIERCKKIPARHTFVSLDVNDLDSVEERLDQLEIETQAIFHRFADYGAPQHAQPIVERSHLFSETEIESSHFKDIKLKIILPSSLLRTLVDYSKSFQTYLDQKSHQMSRSFENSHQLAAIESAILNRLLNECSQELLEFSDQFAEKIFETEFKAPAETDPNQS